MTKKPAQGRAKKVARKARAKTTLRASGRRMARPKPKGTQSSDVLDEFIDASGRALGLLLQPQWRPAIKANLEVTLRLAALVGEFVLPDEAEPAPVFKA